MRKKEQVIMLTSSLFVLTALTMTGVYVKGNNAKEQKEEYRLDFSQLEQGQDADGLMVKNQNPMVEEAPNNDLDYEPDLEEVGSVNVQNPEMEVAEVAEADDTRMGNPETDTENTSGSEEQPENAETGEAQESNSQSVASVEKMDLHFSGENTLALPVIGKVLVNFSMEEPVYFATLEQYRLSPAMVIGVTEGTDVAAMWEAQITDITHSNELGNLVTMSFGDGYECIYGQLEDLQVSVGSYVQKGDIIGKVAAPTKYYSVEGANLYLELLKDEVPVDPMSYMGE